MKKIILSSTNEAKKKATLQIISEIFGNDNVLEAVSVPSGVRSTPLSNEECILGARNRVELIKKDYPNADYYIGAEGGVNKIEDKWYLGGWVVVEDRNGVQHSGSSAWVELPQFLSNLIDGDKPLSEIIQPEFFPKELYDKKEDLGTNGLITKGKYTRINEFYDALKIAFSLFND
jgi:inosine/xanthosine triphosphatase